MSKLGERAEIFPFVFKMIKPGKKSRLGSALRLLIGQLRILALMSELKGSQQDYETDKASSI